MLYNNDLSFHEHLYLFLYILETDWIKIEVMIGSI